MGSNYNDFLDHGTKIVMDYFSSSGADEEERQYVSVAFSDELKKGIGDDEVLGNPELVILSASMTYIDEKISQVLNAQFFSYDDYEKAIQLCERQQELINLFSERNWEIPKIVNTNPKACAIQFQENQSTDLFVQKIVDEDRRIDSLFNEAKSSLAVKTCDELICLINTLEEDLTVCKEKKLTLPEINNKNTKTVIKNATDLRNNAIKKASLQNKIISNDEQIERLAHLSGIHVKEWEEILNLCNKQSSLIKECTGYGWSVPNIKNPNPESIEAIYRHYIGMVTLDNEISEERDSLSTQQQYRKFFADCKSQIDNIALCSKNNWRIPSLVNEDPVALSDKVHIEKRRFNLKNRVKRTLIKGLVSIGAVAAFCLTIFILLRSGKAKLPIDSKSVYGKHVDTVYTTLTNAGFTGVSKKQTNDSYLAGNSVIKVTIDGKDSFDKDIYLKKDAKVIIYYCNEDRIEATELLKDWSNKSYEDLEQSLSDAGFTNIKKTEVTTDIIQMDNQTKEIYLNDEYYEKGPCFLPSKAPIDIRCYTYKIIIGNTNDGFIGKQFTEVIADLKKRGFTNVTAEKVESGWKKGNTVTDVFVSGKTVYRRSDEFKPDVKIVVKYSSNDRIDVTEIVKDYSSKDYTVLVNNLIKKGLRVKKEAIPDENSAKDNKVASIIIDEKPYQSGFCFIRSGSSITVKYYTVKKEILGSSAKDFEGQNYHEVYDQLKEKGFHNIKLLRKDDLLTGLLNKEGSIDSFTIDGRDDFSRTDAFYLDTPIVIIVHTFKDKGCEDIWRKANQ